jgi:hypothetical protein
MATAESASALDLIVCTCGEHQYTARDAIDLDLLRGKLDERWKKFLRDVAAERRADELGLEADETAVNDTVQTFRYEHDLITAEETEAWLAKRNLTFDEFSEYFIRHYYANTLHENVVADEIEYHAASSELRQSFVVDLIFSGELERITLDLAWRLAARCAEADPSPEAISLEERRFLERNKLTPAQLPTWLKGIGRDSNWFGDMLAMETVYQRCCERILVPQSRQRELKTLRMLLTRIGTEVIELESQDAAREALFCVREDGMSMEEVATEGLYPYRRATFLLGEVPVDIQQRFVSASAGDILEPIARGDGFELCRVTQKLEAQADDPSVQSQIDQRLLERHFSELTGKHIQWPLGAASTSAE